MQSHSYVGISRRPLQDKIGECFWLYSCSCRPGSSSLASGLSSVLDVSQSGTQMYCKCINTCAHVCMNILYVNV